MSDYIVSLNDIDSIRACLNPVNGIQVGVNTTYLFDPALIEGYVNLAESWAIGDITERTEGSAKYWAEYSKSMTVPNHDDLLNIHLAVSGQTYGHIDDAAQTIAGVKTFSSSPIVPTPTTDYQAATKKYVDDNAGGGSGLPLLSPLFLDYIPDDASYVLADGSSYVSGSVYTTAYDHLVDDYTNGTSDSEIVGGVSVTFVRAIDGHKIIDVSNLANYQDVLSATGTAWYYVLDTANTRFRLPYTEFFIQGGATTYGAMSAYQAAGVPNITGTISTSGAQSASSGCVTDTIGAIALEAGNVGGVFQTFTINASLSNSIYGNSTTVQPKSNKLALYFFCGNTVVNQDLIDVAGLASKDLDDLSTAGKVMAGMGFGTCSTASATAAKEVSITGFALTTGIRVKVTFTNANTATTPTLNIESTGAKAIYNEGGVAVSATSPAYFPAGATIEFYYDGTNWVYVNRIVDSYVSGYSWYKIFSNGWIEQGGNLGTYSSYSTVIITLLKSLKNTNYSIFCTNAIITGSSYSPIIHEKTTSTFTMRDILTISGLGNWEVKGF